MRMPMDKRGATDERLLGAGEVAEYLGVPVNSLKMWRYRKTGPPWLKLGRHVRYRQAALQRWGQVPAGGVRGCGPRINLSD